jgi:hypothetical protein
MMFCKQGPLVPDFLASAVLMFFWVEMALIGFQAVMALIRSQAITEMISFGAALAMIGYMGAMAMTPYMPLDPGTRKSMTPAPKIGWKGKAATIHFMAAWQVIALSAELAMIC